MWYKVLSVTWIGRWFSLATPVFLTNKTHRHDKAEILLKVAINTITLTIIRVHYPDSELTSLYFYFFMLCSSREAANTYLIVFGLFWTRTHDLLHANHYTTDAIVSVKICRKQVIEIINIFNYLLLQLLWNTNKEV